ncbi:PREDICTED: uncharacterized protein LOC107068473 [Polistes dominula]|uniref:Uncharacterized protein LOC107068473 n=1 Tax=Polistes dominula TaxID=743375 RepID=A0ABM1IJH3_POLDO|nr:PREDICTED: uncharacterized protein LOC107068473 [Polistes dominula]
MKVRTAVVTLIFTIIIVIVLCKRQGGNKQDQPLNQQMDRLKDTSFMKKQLDCILDRAPCDKLGLNMKTMIPKMVVNNCRDCNPSLRQNYGKLRNFMLQYYPVEWNAIIKRYSKLPHASA